MEKGHNQTESNYKVQILIVILVSALLVSLVVNIEMVKDTENNLYLPGTYQICDVDSDMYLMMVEKGNFCRFTQKSGVLDYGTYKESVLGYKLFGIDDNKYCFLYLDDGAYLFESEGNDIAEYRKLSPALIFFDIPGDWPIWHDEIFKS